MTKEDKIREKEWVDGSDEIDVRYTHKEEEESPYVVIDPFADTLTSSQTRGMIEDDDVDDFWIRNGEIKIQMVEDFFGPDEDAIIDEIENEMERAGFRNSCTTEVSVVRSAEGDHEYAAIVSNSGFGCGVTQNVNGAVEGLSALDEAHNGVRYVTTYESDQIEHITVENPSQYVEDGAGALVFYF